MFLHCFSHLLLSFLACLITSVYIRGYDCGLIGSSLFCTGACWSEILLSDEKYNLTRSSCPAVDTLFTIDVRSFEKTSFLILFIFRTTMSDHFYNATTGNDLCATSPILTCQWTTIDIKNVVPTSEICVRSSGIKFTVMLLCPHCLSRTVIATVAKIGHSIKIRRNLANRDRRRICLMQRAATMWNNLPEVVETAKTTNTFKNRLDHSLRWEYTADHEYTTKTITYNI